MKYFFIGAMSLILSGCGTFFGIAESEIDTVNKRLVIAGSQIESLAELTTNLLEVDAITPEQARLVSTNLRSALDAVQTAKDTIELSSDPTQGESALEIVERTLEITLNLLNGFSSESNIERVKYDAGFTRNRHRFECGACYHTRI